MSKQLIFHMTGAIYSANKYDWKRVYGQYGLKWKGDQESWVWLGDGEKMVAFFDMNEYGKKEAIVVWEGDEETDFYYDFKEFWSNINGTKVLDKLPKNEGEAEKTLSAWMMCNKPDVDGMKRARGDIHSGAPEEYIRAAVKDYNKRLAEKKKELGIGD